MNRATRNAVQITAVILGVIYLLLFMPAANGYGYSGYHGFNTRASRWYWNGVEEYHERSSRAESINGPNLLGGGPESGK